MPEDEEPEPERRPPPKRRDDSEKAIGLEMARLFGMSPKQMMAPRPNPKVGPDPPDYPEQSEPDEDPSKESS